MGRSKSGRWFQSFQYEGGTLRAGKTECLLRWASEGPREVLLMSGVERADAYLTIPPGYADSLGGPRWSHRCDAIEWPDGSALALAEELRPLLEGVFTKSPPPFPFVLNAL